MRFIFARFRPAIRAAHLSFPDAFTQDLRYALRTCRRGPGFTLVAVLTLAIGIGANTAVFSLVNAVLLRPLSYPDPSRLVWFLTTAPEGPYGDASDAKFNAWRSIPSTFASVAAFRFSNMNLTGGDRFESVLAGEVTEEFFQLFGAHTQAGRTFTVAEERPGGTSVVVISDAFWTRWFHRSDAVGRTIALNRRTYVVIGVLQAGFDTTTLTSADSPAPDVWVTLPIDPASTTREAQFVVAGRLRQSVSLGEAQARVAAAAGDLRRRFPGYIRAGDSATVERFQPFLARHDRDPLLVLSGAVGLVLLIACANLANLLVARGAARSSELAMRAVLGASRRRIVQQLVTESLLLAAVGGAAGGALGRIAIAVVVALTGPTITRIGLTDHGVPLDATVLVFTSAIALAAVLAFGLVPALIASRVALTGRLNETGGTRVVGRHHRRVGGLLTAVEIGLAIVLLIGSALLIRTFANLEGVRPGFDTQHLLGLQVVADDQGMSSTARGRSIRVGQERLRAIPEIVDATASCCIPLFNGDATLRYVVEGRPVTGLYHGMGGWRPVGPSYFETMQIPLVAGRLFSEVDSLSGPGVVIINQAMADKWWPRGGALGQRIAVGRGIGGVWDEPAREIVGIVANVRDAALDREPQPVNYVPIGQVKAPLQLGWLVRTHGDPEALRVRIELALQQSSGGMPVATVGTMESLIHQSTARSAFRMWLMSAFGVIALLLAAVGVYGVTTYAVRHQTREIGIRIAIGAKPRDITRMVVMTHLGYSLAGLAGGMGCAVWMTRLLTAFLFGIAPGDPTSFVSAVIVLIVVAAVSAWIPARRAARIDPVIALRTS
jgi:putative ABC transport system permease protein